MTAPMNRKAGAGARQSVAARAAASLMVMIVVGVLLVSRPSAGRRDVPLTVAEARFGINPNTASKEELCLLPGVGPVLAERIIAARSEPGAPAFARVEDLDAVPRIGPATVERLRPWVVFDGGDATGRATSLDSVGSTPDDSPN